MTRSPHRGGAPGRRPARKGSRSAARSAGELLPAALRSLGVPSVRLTRKLEDAWRAASDESWHGQTTLVRLVGGVLDVGVRSAALRDELANFHRERLLAVLRTALPDVPLIGMRFVNETSGGGGA